MPARIYNLIFQLIIPVSLVLSLKIFDAEWKRICIALILFLSSPFAWFTGKIIGPELFGNAIGAISIVLLLWKVKGNGFCKNDNRRMRTESIFIVLLGNIGLGISAGIKLNYIVFYVSWVFYFVGHLICKKQRCKVFCCLSMLTVAGFIVDFIVSNPCCITKPEVFIKNIANTGPGDFSLLHIKSVLFQKDITWDLVNAGGLNNTIISILGLAGVYVVGLRVFHNEDRILCLASLGATVFLLIPCCRGQRFLGWYLLPLLYLIPVAAANKKFMYVIVILNFLILLPSLTYQIESKNKQIAFLQNWDEYAAVMNDFENIYQAGQVLYFTEIAPENKTARDFNPIYLYSISDMSQLIFISDRALANADINKIFRMAANHQNGYSLIDTYKSLYICMFIPEG